MTAENLQCIWWFNILADQPWQHFLATGPKAAAGDITVCSWFWPACSLTDLHNWGFVTPCFCAIPPFFALVWILDNSSDFNIFEQEILIWKALICNYGNTANRVTNCLNCNQGFQIQWYVDHWPLWRPIDQIKPFNGIPLFWNQKTLTFPHYLCP